MSSSQTVGVYNLGEFISGGYFLVKRIPRPQHVCDLLPATLMTLSNCFAEIAPDDWAHSGYNYADGERAVEAAKFGIPADAVPRLVHLMTEDWNAFPNLPVARAFYRECRSKQDVVLLGIGLERTLMPSVHAQRNDDVNRGLGLLDRLELQRPIESGGEPLGFEILGFEARMFHSWLCHNAPLEAFERFGIRTNKAGFLDSLNDALHISQHLKSTGAEPAIWEPWLVVRYTEEDEG